MKKTYIIPSLEVVRIETSNIIAASLGINSDPVGAEGAQAPELGPGLETPGDLLGLPDFVFQ